MPLLANLTPDDIKVNDPYVGTVYGNVLDQYDNPTYNLRLYMVKQSAVADLQQKLNNGEYDTDTLVAPSDMIILAQTATTGTQIDNLEMEALAGYEGANAFRASFTVLEPGGASFLDQIQYAKAQLGSDPKTLDNTMFMDIRFQGYTSDITANDEAGEIAIIAGPITYEMQITNIGLRLDQTGSQYDFEALILNTYSFNDSVFKMPFNFDSKGATITEHVESLKTALNNWYKSADVNARVPDQFEIDLSQVIGGSENSLTSISDETVVDNLELKEASSRPPNADVTEPQDAGEAEAEASGSKLIANPGQAEAKPEIILIPHKEGETLETVLENIFANNKEYISKSTRKKDINDSESEARTDQATVAFLKVVTKTYMLSYDKGRNKYGRQYNLFPILYETANANLEEPSTQPKDEEEKKTRLQQLKAANRLLKSYNYLFTGLNDQIIDLDIAYNIGIVSLLPPKGGAVGDIAITNKQLAPAGEEGQAFGLLDSIKDTLNKAKEISNFAKGIDIFEQVGGLTGALQDQFVSAAEGLLGEGSSDAIRAALGDREAAENLLSGLVGQEISSLASAAFYEGQSEINTEAPNTNLPSGSPYSPTLSPFKYSDDFLTADELGATIKSVDDLNELGYINVDGVEFVDPEPSSSAAKDMPLKTDSNPIEVGTVYNKLYGFMSAKKGADVFLTKLQMTVRGDPWFLSTGDPLADSTPDQSNFKKGPNCFWLRIGTPRRYDLDYRDEDNNTGYWPSYGHSRAFSGVYQLIKVVNKFSGGVFTVDIDAQRLYGLEQPASEDLAQLEQDSIAKAQELEKQGQQDAAAANEPDGDNPPTGGNEE